MDDQSQQELAEENILLQAALKYASLGWKVFPAQEPPCGVQFPRPKDEAIKKPRIEGWKSKATDDPGQITAWWTKWPQASIGLLMGPKSGIIVIDTDSEEGEEKFVSLFGGPENVPETVKWRTARGNHYVFQWCTELPADIQRRAHWGYVDSRGKKHDIDFKLGGNAATFVLAPPSIHPRTGEQYQMVCDPEDFSIAELTDEFLANIYADVSGEGIGSESDGPKAKPVEHWLDIASGVQEGGRNNTAAEFIGYVFGQMADPFNNKAVAIQWELIRSWNNQNQPPLDEAELKTVFESILRREREKQNASQEFNSMAKRDPVTGELSNADWRIVKLLSEPPMWKVFSPYWPEQPVIVTSDELNSPGKLEVAIIEQASVGTPPGFRAEWKGSKNKVGLLTKLLMNHDEEEVSVMEKRGHVIAEMVWNAFNSADKHGVKIEIDDGLTQKKINAVSDGSYWVVFGHLLGEHLQAPVEMQVKSRELSKFNKDMGVKFRSQDGVRYCHYTKEIVAKIKEMAVYGCD